MQRIFGLGVQIRVRLWFRSLILIAAFAAPRKLGDSLRLRVLAVKTAWALFQEGCRYIGGTVLVQVADYQEDFRRDLQVRDVESIATPV